MTLLSAIVAVVWLSRAQGWVIERSWKSVVRPWSRQQVSLLSLLDPSRWDAFDYNQQWYPVSWDVDLPVNVPTKITLLDLDYAVVVRDNRTVAAFRDVCPHRAAALSQGHLTTLGYLQCAYHGWSFDDTGKCVEVPQAVPSHPSSRACATAIPACLHQHLVWLWPGPVPEGDLIPKPPSIPEMDDPAFRLTKIVRDFPMIDWTLLASNVLDPDHGLFAHQAFGFDWYSGSRDYPIEIKESFRDGGWTLTTRVLAAEKLLAVNRARTGQALKNPTAVPIATTVFQAPCVISMGRRDAQDKTKFLTCFWISPTGTGRSRFLAAGVGRLPFSLPRWIQHMLLNAFLDQDSVLVASQQPATLSAEVQGLGQQGSTPRQSLYRYQSPTDKSVRLIDAFWDATLPRVPQRATRLREMQLKGELRSIPPRQVILDRQVQHLAVCPDSQATVRNCQRLRFACLMATALWVIGQWHQVLPSAMRGMGWPVTSMVLAGVAERIRRTFYYSYTREKNLRDLDKIAKLWKGP